MADALLSLDDLAVHFKVGNSFAGGIKTLKAVDGVTLDVKPGECLGLVGESGCGKSTLALAIMGLLSPTRGTMNVDGQQISGSTPPDRMKMARTVQMVFQDPYASLNPRQTVRRTLADPLRLHGVTDKAEVEARVIEMMAKVGLRPEQADRYPHEFSGGQRQRIGIARALILKPKLVLCDEPVSALDVSIRAQIINLLLELKDEMGLAYIMISHDLGLVANMCKRVAVMYAGRIVETADTRTLFHAPRHPYTRALQRSIPGLQSKGAELYTIPGLPPDVSKNIPGCAFAPRCEFATDRCTA
eukprot:gene47577-biopygen38567